MPSTSEILFGLSSVANEWRQVAIAWHVALGVSLLAILGGWRPSTRVAAYALISPLVSVAAAAFAFGNVVNGIVFAVLSLALGAVARRFSSESIPLSSPVIAIPGILLVAFGWGYPHFVDTSHWTEYAYGSPLGLLPCPTLSSVAGLSVVCGHFGSRVWALTVTTTGVVYGVIGVFVLGVTLDYFVLVGVLAAVAAFEMSSHVDERHDPVDRVA
jgi:hypothetical protein